MKKFCLCLLLLVCSSLGHAQQDQLQQLSLNIKQTLQTLKQQSIDLQIELTDTTMSLNEASINLKLSNEERQRLMELSTNLQTSLNNMTEQSMKWYESSERYKVRLQIATRIVLIMATILAIMVFVKIIGYILYAKAIKVPRWLDILM